MEAEALADSAAKYVLEGGLTESRLAVRGDGNVGQLVPARISGQSDVTVSFRVRKPLNVCAIEVRQGENVIKTIRKPKALPAEMIQIHVKAEQLNDKDDLEVSVVC